MTTIAELGAFLAHEQAAATPPRPPAAASPQPALVTAVNGAAPEPS